MPISKNCLDRLFIEEFDHNLLSRNIFNSRTAIAGAVIGLLMFFLQYKEFDLF